MQQLLAKHGIGNKIKNTNDLSTLGDGGVSTKDLDSFLSILSEDFRLDKYSIKKLDNSVFNDPIELGKIKKHLPNDKYSILPEQFIQQSNVNAIYVRF